MRKKFAVNLLILLVANLLVKPYWIFGVDRVVQNKVGPEVYGTYFAVFNFSYLFSIVLDFGINNFNNRAVSRNNSRMGEYLLNLMLLKGALSVIYFAITFLTALATGFSEEHMLLLFVLAVNQILLSAILYFRSNIAALQFFKTDSFISVLDRLLTIIFCSLLMFLPAFKNSFNIFWFAYAQTAALLVTGIVSFAVVARHATITTGIWKWKFRKLILLKSAPFAMLALLMGIYYRIDGVMLERLLPNGALEAGIYAASYRLLEAVNMFGYLFATLLLPMFAGMIRKNESIKPLVKFSAELMFAGSVIISVVCFVYCEEIMQLLYPASAPYWHSIFGWLMLNFIPMSSVYVFGTLLTAHGSLRALNTIAIVSVLVNVVLNLLLIPRYAAMGAVTATLVTQTTATIAHVLVAQRKFDLRCSINDLLRLAGFVFVSAGIAYGVHKLPVNRMVSFVFTCAALSAVAFTLKFIPLKELAGVLRSKTPA
ncbi:MAG: oligosaccharide flippase family protein [Chitinophagales bacterium]|nr:oligosaccharide flippase family protein [Chitinophagales bacterium]